MSDTMSYEDRQRIIQSTLSEHITNFLRSDAGRRLLDEYVLSLKEAAGAGSSAPPPQQRQETSQQRLSAFDKFVLGR